MECLNQKRGLLGEEMATDYLKTLDYIIVERNFRCKIGEIDIIARDKDFFAFVEVKTRSSNLYGTPGEAVNFFKKQKIYKTAQLYILKNNISNLKFRFDVIEVLLDKKEKASSITLIKDAFGF